LGRQQIAREIFRVYKERHGSEYTLTESFDELDETEKKLLLAVADIVHPLFLSVRTHDEIIEKLLNYLEDELMDCGGCIVIRKLEAAKLHPIERLKGGSRKTHCKSRACKGSVRGRG
jgi:hypothetical protein